MLGLRFCSSLRFVVVNSTLDICGEVFAFLLGWTLTRFEYDVRWLSRYSLVIIRVRLCGLKENKIVLYKYTNAIQSLVQ